jgi:hypothetical protein
MAMDEFDNKLLDLKLFLRDMFLDIRDLWRVKSNPVSTSREAYTAAMNTMYVMQTAGLGWLLERYTGPTVPNTFAKRNILEFGMLLKEGGYSSYGNLSEHMKVLAEHMISNAGKIEEILLFDYSKYHVTINKLYDAWLTVDRILAPTINPFRLMFTEFHIDDSNGIPIVNMKTNVPSGRVILKSTTGAIHITHIVNGEASIQLNEFAPSGDVYVYIESITMKDSELFKFTYTKDTPLDVVEEFIPSEPEDMSVEELLNTRGLNTTENIYESITLNHIDLWEVNTDERTKFDSFWDTLDVTLYEPIQTPFKLINETTGQPAITVEEFENIIKGN